MTPFRPDPSPSSPPTPRPARATTPGGRALVALPALALALLALTGCKSFVSDDPTGNYVSASDTQTVVTAERFIQAECIARADVTPQDLTQAVKGLIQVYREGPTNSVKYGSETAVRNMKTVVEQNAQLLDECGARADGASLLAGTGLSA